MSRAATHASTVLFWAVLIWSVPSASAAQSPPSEQSRATRLHAKLPLIADFGPGQMSLGELARRVAPALWPSPSELYPVRAFPVQSSPNDITFAAGPPNTVFYRITAVRFDDHSRPLPALNSPLDPDDLSHLTEVHVRYFFYFGNESGDTSHVNDFESTELWVLCAVEPTAPSLEHVYLWKAFGAAHGLSWATNIADLSLTPALSVPKTWHPWLKTGQGCSPDDVEGKTPEGQTTKQQPSRCLYKLMVIIEEGKHATAPDINGDGVITPMIDLNASASDAWGIRDSLGTDSRVSPAFSGDMFIPRSTNDIQVPADFQSEIPRRLSLIESHDTPVCRPNGGLNKPYLDALSDYQHRNMKPLHIDSLEKLVQSKQFCHTQVSQRVATMTPRGGRLFRAPRAFKFGNPYATWRSSINLAYRFDRGLGASIGIPVAFSPPLIGGWFVSKFNLPFPPGEANQILRFGQVDHNTVPKAVDLIYMPSASRKAGWYGGGGWEWDRAKDRHDFEVSTAGIAWEFGFKMRATEWKGLLASARFGYRFSGTTSIHDQRFVLEVGVGTW